LKDSITDVCVVALDNENEELRTQNNYIILRAKNAKWLENNSDKN